jgi:simple sugar transport system permease protein
VNAYWQLLIGAFGSRYSISETIIAAIPLMLAGLAVALPFEQGCSTSAPRGRFS